MVLLVLTLAVGLGCGAKTETGGPQSDTTANDTSRAPIAQVAPWEDPKFATWKRAEFENVVVYFPPEHIHAAQMPQGAKEYKGAMVKISGMLGMPVPTDTVRIFYFTGPGQGYAVTGRDFPYGDSLAVYYWPNYSRGVSLMQRLFYSYFGTWSGQRIMHHGLIALFDYAGTNYNQSTIEFLRDTFFIPIGRLAQDTVMNSDMERYQSAEAASLVAFLLGSRGAITLQALYHATIPFDQAVQQNLGISVDSLQKEWIAFLEKTVGPIDTTQSHRGQ